MKRILIFCLVLILLSFAPLSLFAEEPVVVGIEQGEAAPFNGVLFNNTAASAILAQQELMEKRCLIEIETAVEKSKAEQQLTIDDLELSLAIEDSRWRSIVDNQEESMRNMEELMREQENNYDYIWWGIGGVGTGAIIATVVTLLVIE